jgi:DNA repair protein RadC
MSNIQINDALSGASLGSVLCSGEATTVTEPLKRLIGDAAATNVLTWAGATGLRSMSAAELAEVTSIDVALAERLVACRDLSLALDVRKQPRLECSRSVVRALPTGIETLETEVMLGCAIDVRSRLIATVLLARGGKSHTAVTLRDVFTPMIRLGASGLVIIHNHPSGDVTPSASDVNFTNRVVLAGDSLGIVVLDHLIIGGKDVLSFADTGLLASPEELRRRDDH